MAQDGSGVRYRPRRYLLIVASIAAIIITSSAADARHHRSANVPNHSNEDDSGRNTHAEAYSPPSASIVVDGYSGAVLQASNPDALRHPASLTKIMTLYLLFERLDAGRIRLDTPLKVSEHASEQAPTKLGLQAGQSIIVEDAIKGMVTKSANDAAVVVAENLGGDEGKFARLMTQTARAIGMTRTIQEHFPRYYKYFSTESFVYHGEAMRNHNHLLGSVDGVDGIKTGFTRASGFNLVTSVHRSGRYLVAVVMGGHSSFERDAEMRKLISVHIKQASLRGTGRVIVEHDWHQSIASVDVQPAAEPADPIQPPIVSTVTLQAAPEQSRSSAEQPPLLSSDAPNQPPGTSHPNAQVPTRWPSKLEVFASVDSMQNAKPSIQATPAVSEPARKVEAEPHASRHAHGGWLIQIGAFDGENEAKEHLTAARLKMSQALVVPITERFQKGHKALYRARFAGFDKASAESTCKQLKRSAFDCIALQN
jgi:D-alanyl-D-alanine carboxypeptidase